MMKRNLFFIVLLAFAGLAIGQPQQSANFKIAKSVIDAGGGQSNSANFGLYSAFGQPTPVGVQTSANFRLSAGYLNPLFAPGELNPIDDLVIQRIDATNDIKLTWGQIAGATSYNIHRGTTSAFVPSGGNLIGTTTDSSYTDLGVIPSAPTQLFYIVTAQAGSLLLTPIHLPQTSSLDLRASPTQQNKEFLGTAPLGQPKPSENPETEKAKSKLSRSK